MRKFAESFGNSNHQSRKFFEKDMFNVTHFKNGTLNIFLKNNGSGLFNISRNGYGGQYHRYNASYNYTLPSYPTMPANVSYPNQPIKLILPNNFTGVPGPTQPFPSNLPRYP